MIRHKTIKRFQETTERMDGWIVSVSTFKKCVLICVFMLCGCGGDDVKIYKYPGGQIMLREEYENGKQSKSTWYSLSGTVLETTEWKNGTGTSYQLEPGGWISAQIPMVNGFADGTAQYFDSKGNTVATREFKNGEAMTEKIPYNDQQGTENKKQD